MDLKNIYFQTLRCLFQRLLSIILMLDGVNGTRSVAVLGVGQRTIIARDQAITFVRSVILAKLFFLDQILRVVQFFTFKNGVDQIATWEFLD